MADLDNQRLLTNHAITIVLSGKLDVHTDEGLPLRVNEGELVVLPKGLYAITDLIPNDQPFTAYVIFFEDELLEKFLKYESMSEKNIVEREPRLFDQSTSLQSLLSQLTLDHETQQDQQLTELKILELLRIIAVNDDSEQFLPTLFSLNQKPKKQIATFMEAHFSKPLAVEDFAMLTGVSVSTFRRSFHQTFSESPKKWLIRRRLSMAKAILSQEKLPITQVAAQVGYTDIPHFIKSFQLAYQLSPLQFSKKNFQSR